MKNNALNLVVFFLLSVNVLAGQGDFTIAAIGQSNSTNTVFIDTVEEVRNTSCSNKKLLRLPDSDKSSDRLFSLALAALEQNKKISITYSDSVCINNGSLIEVFHLKR